MEKAKSTKIDCVIYPFFDQGYKSDAEVMIIFEIIANCLCYVQCYEQLKNIFKYFSTEYNH